jgi:hypothetical protein
MHRVRAVCVLGDMGWGNVGEMAAEVSVHVRQINRLTLIDRWQIVIRSLHA